MASQVSVRVEIDEKALKRAVSYAPGVQPLLSKESAKIAAKANSLATGFRTGIWHETGKPHTPGKTGGKWHDHGESFKTIGDQPAHYSSNAKMGSKGYVGLVYPANYSAQKENHLHNTLLKAKG